MIRRLKSADAEKIERILNKIPQFTETEVKVAMELVNIAATNKTQTDYNVFVYEVDGKVLGYYCIGRRPLTDGVYDLYWIAADPASGIRGIGTILVEHAERFAVENDGRWLLAETSSRDIYSGTRSFYLRNKFTIVAEINDFYSVGDNLIVFGKYLVNKNKQKG
jgi:aminoglycoside 6'-N-acetyltransferase I